MKAIEIVRYIMEDFNNTENSVMYIDSISPSLIVKVKQFEYEYEVEDWEDVDIDSDKAIISNLFTDVIVLDIDPNEEHEDETVILTMLLTKIRIRELEILHMMEKYA